MSSTCCVSPIRRARANPGRSRAKRSTRTRRGAAKRPRNIDYWYCGCPTLKPIAASDDGVHTRLRFAAQRELPAIFVRNDDGSESLLNFSMDAGDVVVHRVAHQFILRRGKLAGCIVNQGFTGGGHALDSGTVTPEVRAHVPGVCRERPGRTVPRRAGERAQRSSLARPRYNRASAACSPSD